MRWSSISIGTLTLAVLASPAVAIAGPATPPPPADTGSTVPAAVVPSAAPGTTPPAPGSADAPGAGDDDGGATGTTSNAPPEDLSDNWGYARGSAQLQPRYTRSTEDPVLFAPNPIGFYSGVSLAGNQVPPHPAPKMGTNPAMMTWTGFERTPEGSRVFFQLSAEPSHQVKIKGNTITIRFKNTRVGGRNNMRRLDLRYFRTPVQYVRVRRRGKTAVATITLKRPADADIKMIDEGGSGYKLLVVGFAEGRSDEPNDAPAVAPTSPTK